LKKLWTIVSEIATSRAFSSLTAEIQLLVLLAWELWIFESRHISNAPLTRKPFSYRHSFLCNSWYWEYLANKQLFPKGTAFLQGRNSRITEIRLRKQIQVKPSNQDP
jgi:hypothetical protein